MTIPTGVWIGLGAAQSILNIVLLRRLMSAERRVARRIFGDRPMFESVEKNPTLVALPPLTEGEMDSMMGSILVVSLIFSNRMDDAMKWLSRMGSELQLHASMCLKLHAAVMKHRADKQAAAEEQPS